MLAQMVISLRSPPRLAAFDETPHYPFFQELTPPPPEVPQSKPSPRPLTDRKTWNFATSPTTHSNGAGADACTELAGTFNTAG